MDKITESYIIVDDIASSHHIPHYIFNSREELIKFFRNITRKGYYYLDDLICYRLTDEGKVIDSRRIQGDEFNEILIEAGREELINFIHAGYEEEEFRYDIGED